MIKSYLEHNGFYLWKNNNWESESYNSYESYESDESEIELEGQKFGWDGEKLTTFDNTFYFN